MRLVRLTNSYIIQYPFRYRLDVVLSYTSIRRDYKIALRPDAKVKFIERKRY